MEKWSVGVTKNHGVQSESLLFLMNNDLTANDSKRKLTWTQTLKLRSILPIWKVSHTGHKSRHVALVRSRELCENRYG